MSRPDRIVQFKLPEAYRGQRFDQCLRELALHAADGMRAQLPDDWQDASRSAWQRLLQEQRIEVAGRAVRAAGRVQGGELVHIALPPAVAHALEPTPMALDILYEDSSVLVLNKPTGLVVHPGAGHGSGTLAHGLLAHCATLAHVGNVMRPGIVHRLDKGTSGVMMVAKTQAAYLQLVAQFAARQVRKGYLACVWGEPPVGAGVHDTAFGRHPRDRKRFTSCGEHDKRAYTAYRRIGRRGGLSVMELQPRTGRTHQLRVHMADWGYPIVGDPMYAHKRRPTRLAGDAQALVAALPAQALHAATLQLSHPDDQRPLNFTAPLPGPMRALADYVTGKPQDEG